jgi:hypothetical protein
MVKIANPTVLKWSSCSGVGGSHNLTARLGDPIPPALSLLLPPTSVLLNYTEELALDSGRCCWLLFKLRECSLPRYGSDCSTLAT